MLYYIYDNTFEGLLTCVFDSFYRKETPLKILSKENDVPLFSDHLEVISDEEKAERVLRGLKLKISDSAVTMLFTCFLSELKDIANPIFRYICKAFQSEKSIELNFADPDVLELSKIYKKVSKEGERMRQFVRFQKTADDIFFACIEPKYNVLPLAIDFFEDRFADQQWIVYDIKRKYGFFYDLEKTTEIRFENQTVAWESGKLPEQWMADDEADFQQLWKQYFRSTAIKERINLKLQRQHMPKRFWKYLIEKQ